MTSRVKVALVGIPDREKGYFDQVARFSKNRQRAYEIWGEAPETSLDLVVANDQVSALEQAQALLKGSAAARLVIVSDRGSSAKSEHLLTRPLLISRVLRILDQASDDVPGSAADATGNTASAAGTDRESRRVHPLAPMEPTGTGNAQQLPTTAEAKPVSECIPRPGSTSLPQPGVALRTEEDTLSAIPDASIQARNRGPWQAPALTPKETISLEIPERKDNRLPPQARKAGQLLPRSERAPTPEPFVQASKTGVKALVVDDSLAIRKQLEIELGEAGIAANYAETGEQALEMAAEAHFDLVFLDIMMPGIDGYEVCKRLRKAPEHKKTPIIMLSGKTSPLDEVQGVLAGATTYLTKPVKHEGFQTVLGRVVKWLDEYRADG